MQTLEYETIKPGLIHRTGPHLVSEDEIIDYARRWDPRPIHTDRTASQLGPFKGLTGSSSHTLAIRTRLLHDIRPAVPNLIATVGWDELRFPNPLRPGDEIWLTREWLEKRKSKSKIGIGIVKHRIILLNQDNEEILNYIDNIIMKIN